MLYRTRRNGAERALALSLASLALLVVANALPFMTFQMGGLVETNRLASGVIELFAHGFWQLAVLVFFAVVLAPALRPRAARVRDGGAALRPASRRGSLRH